MHVNFKLLHMLLYTHVCIYTCVILIPNTYIYVHLEPLTCAYCAGEYIFVYIFIHVHPYIYMRIQSTFFFKCIHAWTPHILYIQLYTWIHTHICIWLTCVPKGIQKWTTRHWCLVCRRISWLRPPYIRTHCKTLQHIQHIAIFFSTCTHTWTPHSCLVCRWSSWLRLPSMRTPTATQCNTVTHCKFSSHVYTHMNPSPVPGVQVKFVATTPFYENSYCNKLHYTATHCNLSSHMYTHMNPSPVPGVQAKFVATIPSRLLYAFVYLSIYLHIHTYACT